MLRHADIEETRDELISNQTHPGLVLDWMIWRILLKLSSEIGVLRVNGCFKPLMSTLTSANQNKEQ